MPLPTPIGEQSDVLFLPANRNVVVLGTAGSGKTTLALLRAARLCHSGTTDFGPTVLVTFNVALVTYLQHLLDTPALRSFDIRNYHHFARGILTALGQDMDNAILEGEQHQALIQEIIADMATRDSAAILKRPLGFFVEEFKWIAQNGISAEADYLSRERAGRVDSRLRRQDRPLVFQAYQRYVTERIERGWQYSWDDLATGVRQGLRNPPEDFRPLYRHIVVDEGQDFSPEMLRSLAEALQPGGTITFFGDVAQQIYGHRISWRSAGIPSPLIHEFRQNYRNTKQIAALALALSEMSTFGHLAEELVAPRSPKADGPLPALRRMKDPDAEIAWAVKQAIRLGSAQSVAILARDRGSDATFRSSIAGATCLSRRMKGWKAGPGVYFGTLHSAKGLEFDTVIMIGCGDAEVAKDHWYEDLDDDEAASIISKLLYVGITRARRNLIITYAGNLTPLLPQQAGLYDSA